MTGDRVQAIRWVDEKLLLLDQRLLPRQVDYVECSTAQDVARSIRDMIVRGAPAIGCAAAFGVALSARDQSGGDLEQSIAAGARLLRESRPTAINLGWAIDRMLRRWEALRSSPLGSAAAVSSIYDQLVIEAETIFKEDLDGNHKIGALGSLLIKDSATVLTHCNAGALATSGYGTALGVIRAVHESGKKIAVFAGETRPYLQGARLTAWELMQEGIDVTLISDNMAGHFFQLGTFDAVIVGADRIAANGDTANKIGTYTLAVLAKTHLVPFYVAAPVSTIDLACSDGMAIPIEERSHDEMVQMRGWDHEGSSHTVSNAPEGVTVRHPAFDVTPASLISAIITEKGVVRRPFRESIGKLFG